MMSRRKQARPIRALKNSKSEDEDNGARDETSLASSQDESSDEPQTEETQGGRDDVVSFTANSPPDPHNGESMPLHAKDGRVEIEGATTFSEEGKPSHSVSNYRCEKCSLVFGDLPELVHHKKTNCNKDFEQGAKNAETLSCRDNTSPSYPLSDDEMADSIFGVDGLYGEVDSQYYLEHQGLVSTEGSGFPYPCQFCDKAFSKLSYLKHHEQSHEDKLPYKCEYCRRLFKHKRSRDRHIHLHTGDKKYNCIQCGLSFARSDHLKIHTKTHSMYKPYTCAECNVEFTSADELLFHNQSYHNGLRSTEHASLEKRSSESISPGQSTPQIYSLLTGKPSSYSSGRENNNYNNQTSPTNTPIDCTITNVRSLAEKPKTKALDHGCPFCSKKDFLSVESLNSHIQKNHKVDDSNPYTCNLCGKVYPSYYNLVEHISVIHEHDNETDEKGGRIGKTSKDSGFYICGYCTMKFASMPSLHEHVKSVHAVGGLVSFIEDGKLVCAHCNAGFPSDVALMDHFRNVHGLQNAPQVSTKVSCPQCTKSYPNNKILYEHIRRCHSQPLDQMRYPCPYCVKQNLFDSIEQLQLHVEVLHKSEQEPIFLCPDDSCKAHFNNDKDLKRHAQQEHSYSSSKNYTSPLSGHSFNRESPKGENFPPMTSPDTASRRYEQNGGTPEGSTRSPSVTDEVKNKFQVMCQLCQNGFPSEDALYQHSLVHFKDEMLEYTCKDCDKRFKRPDELQKHLFEIHAHHLFKCALCKEVFDSKVSIQVHFAVKHSNEVKIFGCIKCGVTYQSEVDLLKHVKVDHLNVLNYHKCLFCNQTFASEVDLQCHLVTHSQVYKCGACNIPFGTQGAFQLHIKMVHESKTSPRITFSPESLGMDEVNVKKRKIEMDVVSSGNEVKPSTQEEDVGQEGCFVCQICDDKFPLKMLLDLHHQSKHNLKARSLSASPALSSSPTEGNSGQTAKFSCVICGKLFSSRQKVLDHVPCHASHLVSYAPAHSQAQPQASTSVSAPPLHPPETRPPSNGNHHSMCICQICQRPIRSESEFMWHTQVHQTDISVSSDHIRCVICLQVIIAAELSSHAQYHLPMPLSRDNYLCYACGKTYFSRSEVVPKLDEFGRPFFLCIHCNHGNHAGMQGVPEQSSIHDKYVATQPKASVRCHKCNVKFESQAELASHLPTHQNKTYQCIKCQQTFASEEEIQMHVTSHVLAEGVLHECKLCHMILDSPAKLQCHLIEHTFPDREFKCPVCKGVFASAQDIQGHAIEHGMDARQHQCNQCSQAFFFSAELENHLLSHPHFQESKSYQCSECNLAFHSLGDISEHMKTHQTKPKHYRCSVCDESFTSSSQVQQHYANHHKAPTNPPSPQEYQCFYCDKTFPGVSNLQGHMKVHSEGKKYTCPECNKVFALERNLTVHMRSHNTEKPFQCPICEKRFAKKEHRKIHMKSHSGFKSFLCPFCNKMFAKKIQLREHMRVHSGQTVKSGLHRCDICYETFTLSKNLRRHKKRVHKVIPPSSVGHAPSGSSSEGGDVKDSHDVQNEDQMDDRSAEVTSSQDLNMGGD